MARMAVMEMTFYTRQQTADILQVNVRTVDKLVKDDKLKITKVGGSTRFLGKDILNIGGWKIG